MFLLTLREKNGYPEITKYNISACFLLEEKHKEKKYICKFKTCMYG